MDLILWRHAEAEDGSPDLARRLTARGHRQAQRVAAWLHAQLPDDARILVSPAVRAQQTAQALADAGRRRLHTVDAIAPDADVQPVLDAAGWPDAPSAAVIVGHQPTLGQVASFLLAGEALYWSVKKAGVWWISARVRDGELQTVLRAVVGPDQLL